jgi:hypothetical protein
MGSAAAGTLRDGAGGADWGKGADAVVEVLVADIIFFAACTADLITDMETVELGADAGEVARVAVTVGKALKDNGLLGKININI